MKKFAIIIFVALCSLLNFTCRKEWVKAEDVVQYNKENIIDYKLKGSVIFLDSSYCPKLINDSTLIMKFVEGKFNLSDQYFCEFMSDKYLFLGFTIIKMEKVNEHIKIQFNIISINDIFETYEFKISDFTKLTRDGNNCLKIGEVNVNKISLEKDAFFKASITPTINLGTLCYFEVSKDSRNLNSFGINLADASVGLKLTMSGKITNNLLGIEKVIAETTFDIPIPIPSIPGLGLVCKFGPSISAETIGEFNLSTDLILKIPISSFGLKDHVLNYSQNGPPLVTYSEPYFDFEKGDCKYFPILFNNIIGEIKGSAIVSASWNLMVGATFGKSLVQAGPGIEFEFFKCEAKMGKNGKLSFPARQDASEVCLEDCFNQLARSTFTDIACVKCDWDINTYLWCNTPGYKFSAYKQSIITGLLNLPANHTNIFSYGTGCSDEEQGYLEFSVVDIVDNIEKKGGIMNVIYKNNFENDVQIDIVVYDANNIKKFGMNDLNLAPTEKNKYSSISFPIDKDSLKTGLLKASIASKLSSNMDKLKEKFFYYNGSIIDFEYKQKGFHIKKIKLSGTNYSKMWTVNNSVVNELNLAGYVSQNNNYPFTIVGNNLLGSLFLAKDLAADNIIKCPEGFKIPSKADWNNLINSFYYNRVVLSYATIQRRLVKLNFWNQDGEDFNKISDLNFSNELGLDIKLLGSINPLFTSISPETAVLEKVGKEVYYYTSDYEEVNGFKIFEMIRFYLEDNEIKYEFIKAANIHQRAFCRCIQK